MKINKDELFLLNRLIDEDSELKVYMQALRIALHSHIKMYEYARAAVDKFGGIPPFANIVQLHENAIGLLVYLCETHGVELVKNSWDEKTILPEVFNEACEVAIGFEIESYYMYDKLLDIDLQDDIKDIFYRLQASSYNEILPSLRNFVVSKTEADAKPISQEKIMEKFGEISNMAQELQSGNIDPNRVNQMLGSLNLPLISGALLGALGLVVTKEMANQDKSEEE